MSYEIQATREILRNQAPHYLINYQLFIIHYPIVHYPLSFIHSPIIHYFTGTLLVHIPVHIKKAAFAADFDILTLYYNLYG